jgi:hypothetical protein
MALTGYLTPTPLLTSSTTLPPVAHSKAYQLRNSRTIGFGLRVDRHLFGIEEGNTQRLPTVRAMAEKGTAGSRVEEKLGIRIEREPAEARLKELGIRSWPKYVPVHQHLS